MSFQLSAMGLIAVCADANTPDFSYDPVNMHFNISWPGEIGRSYYLQHSPDLFQWNHLPFMSIGNDNTISFNIDTTGTRDFFRVSSVIDLDADLLADHIETQIFADPNKYIYDPTSLYIAENLVSADQDYDGDGVSNLDEFLAGTDPADYYNGDDPLLTVVSGDHQLGLPNAFLNEPFKLLVTDVSNNPLPDAPVIFQVLGSHNGLHPTNEDGTTGEFILVVFTDEDGITAPPGSSAYFKSGNDLGTTMVNVSANDTSTNLSVTTADEIPPSPLLGFSHIDNSDGSRTYSWDGTIEDADYFNIESEDEDGNTVIVFEATKGSPNWPVRNVETGRYEVTVQL